MHTFGILGGVLAGTNWRPCGIFCHVRLFLRTQPVVWRQTEVKFAILGSPKGSPEGLPLIIFGNFLVAYSTSQAESVAL